ncbi:hypothetical protein G7048_03710 [Diaphorobacter sp. HDW4B]|uniref:hypothetical protein n=1 Tax=Diaphorobacter sp. HDW4B TaxID=2714925 RepID=UPI0014073BE3|nr:hypothetical protein [Diaphorobacter sp. HDW4B]QIL69557.1 hypothetical protein G7048_03710 [Diaphorobacter sp. HDW4B]
MSRLIAASGGAFTLNITASVANPDIRALAIAAGWSPSKPLIVNITAPLINTLNLGSTAFAGGLRINISASTRIGGVLNSGTALTTGVAVEINNLGIISGGGGKGGAGASVWCDYSASRVGGAGGAGGDGQGFLNASSLTVVAAGNGASGSYSEYSGSVVGTRPWASGGPGGNGGAWGTAGSAGADGSVGGNYSAAGYESYAQAGVAAGNAVNGNSKVTWIATGTRLGGLIN